MVKEYNYKCEICEKRKPKSQMRYNQGHHYSCKECCDDIDDLYGVNETKIEVNL